MWWVGLTGNRIRSLVSLQLGASNEVVAGGRARRKVKECRTNWSTYSPLFLECARCSDMSERNDERECLSIGQLARRWGVSPERIKQLIAAGKLGGSFKVPSAGRYGAAIRIPMDHIRLAERQWLISATAKSQPRTESISQVHPHRAVDHFPELTKFRPDDPLNPPGSGQS